jgi:hypothetical protein
VEYVVAALVLPLDASSYCLEWLHTKPLALPLGLTLACVPPQWVIQVLSLVKLYPLFATIAILAVLVVAALGWLLFGPLIAALVRTIWWFAWYSPLLYGVGRLAWILCRRFVLGRLGWRQRIDAATATARQSIQERFQGALQALVRLAFSAPTTQHAV